MFSISSRCLVLAVSGSAALLLGVGGAFAQTKDALPTTEPALKGPTVDTRPEAKKNTSGFGPDAVAKKSAVNTHATPLTMAEFLKLVDVLRAASTPEAARLTSEEDSHIKAIVADLESSSKTYMDSHAQELEALRAKLSATDLKMLDQQLARGGPIKLSKAGFGGRNAVGKAKSKGGSAASPDAMGAAPQSKEDAAKTRTRIVEIYAGRPKAEDAQAKILGALTPEQLTIVNEALAKQDDASKTRKHYRGAKGKKA